jgi:uncharacterized protein (TIGR03067 family)
MRCYLAAALIPSVFLTAGGALNAQEDLKKLEGTWDVTFIEAGGARTPAGKVSKGLRFIIKGDQLKMTSAADKAGAELTITLDASKKPKAIDLTWKEAPFKNKTALGIYAFEGETLKICFPDDPDEDNTRPKTFMTKKGSLARVYWLKLAK